MLADLHLHSTCSDGTHEPLELCFLCRQLGLEAIAITDHDSWEAHQILSAVRLPAGLTLITGIELSTAHAGSGLGLHILGYQLQPDDEFLEQLDRIRSARQDRVRKTAGKLAKLGIHIDVAGILARGGAPGKPDVARGALADPANRDRLAQDQVSTIAGFIRAYLQPGRPAFTPKMKLVSVDAVRAICRCGGRPVWAHPALELRSMKDLRARQQCLDDVLDELMPAGLAGIEAFNFAHTPQEVAWLEEVARARGLRITAGSDFHDETDTYASRILTDKDQDL